MLYGVQNGEAAAIGPVPLSEFYNGPVQVRDGKVEGTPILAEPWAPVGTLDVATADFGEVFGRLIFPPNAPPGFMVKRF